MGVSCCRSTTTVIDYYCLGARAYEQLQRPPKRQHTGGRALFGKPTPLFRGKVVTLNETKAGIKYLLFNICYGTLFYVGLFISWVTRKKQKNNKKLTTTLEPGSEPSGLASHTQFPMNKYLKNDFSETILFLIFNIFYICCGKKYEINDCLLL